HPHLLFNEHRPSYTYTLSLHDALPIYPNRLPPGPLVQQVYKEEDRHGLDARGKRQRESAQRGPPAPKQVERQQHECQHLDIDLRSEEHTSELQSPYDLVCRLLLEKKKK